MLTDDLRELGAPALRELVAQRFWSGLRDGSLPGAALARFVEQDTGHLLPAFGRAFTRCAASAVDAEAYETAKLLSRCGLETLLSAPRLAGAFAGLVSTMGVPALATDVEATPVTVAYRSAIRTAADSSLAAGLGILTPFMVFHLEMCDDLFARRVPGSRYLPWIEIYEPGEGTRFAVRAFLDIVDGFGAQASAQERAEFVDAFAAGARHELAFAGAAAPAFPR